MLKKLQTTRAGFTILELLMVLAIIGVLMGIVTNAVFGSIRQARDRKASTCCKIVEQALATYYAQKGKWPGSIGSTIASGSLQGNYKSSSGEIDPNRYELSSSEIRSMISDIVMEAKNGNPMMDISGLYVSRKTGEKGSKDYGLDFMDAVRGKQKKDFEKRMKVAEMNFGYPESSNGYFRRFKVIYSIPTDEMKVSKQ